MASSSQRTAAKRPTARKTPSRKASTKARRDPLSAYDAKRNFNATTEPRGGTASTGRALQFVIQRHDASHLHYDFRLELDGTLKSWALPKQPSPDVKSPRLAVQVEDHPLAYASFEGDIPQGNYGAGHVDIWDSGTWIPEGNAKRDYAKGKLSFTLQGTRMRGHWTLVRTDKPARQPQWLLIHRKDGAAVKSVAPAKGQRKSLQSPRSSASPPDTLSPMLATLADAAPDPAGWHAELKLDGYRVLIRIAGSDIRVFTRSGQDWSHRFKPTVDALRTLKLPNAWLDGEAVVLDARGLPDFQALQRAFDAGTTDDIVVYVFDLPWCNGQDLRDATLQTRQSALAALFDGKPLDEVRVLEPVHGALADLWHGACEAGLEGIIVKRDDSPYVTGRSDAWRKLKCSQRQEFVVLGFTDPAGSRQGFGALLLGYYDDDGKTLRYAGKVGTGFDTADLLRMRKRLDSLVTRRAPLDPMPRLTGTHGVHWLRPTLVAEVRFAEWTRDAHVRQASFLAMRSDKPATQIRREVRAADTYDKSDASDSPDSPDSPNSPDTPPETSPMSGATQSKRKSTAQAVKSSRATPVRLTHGERVMDTHSGVTKAELAAYYDAVSPWMLPHLAERPVAVLRAPEGIGGEMFFQKHAAKAIQGVRALDPSLDPDHAPLMQIDDRRGLAGAVQMGSVEFHTWNARSDLIERPDRVIFDLDPGKGVAFAQIVEGAQLIRGLLEALGLAAFVKTSGGKGLHVVTPLARRHDWDVAKGFAEAVARHMASVFPDRFTATMGPKHRVGKCFIDYLRNYRGATTVCAYSARAREGMAVSMPVSWESLDTLPGADAWNVRNAVEYLESLKQDPWADYETSQSQRVTKSMLAKLGG
ncbi:DNA ligase D [Pandoraea iniqua]|uniref:DNA ligase (ATP) n=1 Tax=Pandoraea iniqua TaxID=2508288 RepID=A0A5E4SSR0_9BURK|nr:DNA ligase D [Pandoraea iniqua]VVD77992.1 DNA ligase D [Pandoraea iniqua]